MAFKFKGKDWWTERGWHSAPGGHCVVCGSSYNLGIHPEVPWTLCEFHSHCTMRAVELALECQRLNREISKNEWDLLSLNSYDRDTLIPYMSTEVLIANTQYTLQNCTRSGRPAGTYDEALQLYASELVKRLK